MCFFLIEKSSHDNIHHTEYSCTRSSRLHILFSYQTIKPLETISALHSAASLQLTDLFTIKRWQCLDAAAGNNQMLK